MKLFFSIVAVAVVLLGCSQRATSSDVIDRLMVQVAHETVGSYLFVPIDLPATASPEQLVSALSKRGDFGSRQIQSFKIVKIRPAQSGPDDWQRYTAVLLDTNVGQKIVLLRQELAKDKWYGWYFNIYDVK
jgi:hypothetical protein